MLLTKCLPEETNGDSDRAAPTFSPPNGKPRLPLPGLAIRKKPVLWAISRVFLGPVNLVNSFP
jgi:hypothetical protein